MVKFNFDTDPGDIYSGDPQNKDILEKVTSRDLDEGVRKILELSVTSQDKLIDMLNEIKNAIGDDSTIVYNPGVKTYESAIRKVDDGKILKLNDGYRGSIITNDMKNIEQILKMIESVLSKYKFTRLSVLNTFDKPWPNGYKDYNCRIQDNDNQNLVGELQIHFCPIKLFSQTVGHLSYELLRALDERDPCTSKVRDALEQIATAGYTSASEIPDKCCIDKIKQLQSKQSGGKVSVKHKLRKPRKWSRKYKRSINCRRPRGFSQKQYCKYGRK